MQQIDFPEFRGRKKATFFLFSALLEAKLNQFYAQLCVIVPAPVLS